MIWDRGGLESCHRWSSIIYHTWSDIICSQMSAITSLVPKLSPQVICGTVGDRGSQASYTRSHTHYCMSKCHTPLHGQMSYAITSLIPRLSHGGRREHGNEAMPLYEWSNIKYSPFLQLVIGTCLVHVQVHRGQAADFHNLSKLVLPISEISGAK